jgi:hypothetical protein
MESAIKIPSINGRRRTATTFTNRFDIAALPMLIKLVFCIFLCPCAQVLFQVGQAHAFSICGNAEKAPHGFPAFGIN